MNIIYKSYLYSHLYKVKFILHIMLVNQAQLHYYYNILIKNATPHGSQAIRIYVYPKKGYKTSGHACSGFSVHFSLIS